MENEVTTYEQGADEVGMAEPQRGRFLVYMTIRWSESEELKCRVRYAHEWAERFKGGYEYASSDGKGQAILDRMRHRD